MVQKELCPRERTTNPGWSWRNYLVPVQRLFGCDPRGLFELNHQSFINNSSYDSVIWLFVLLFRTALQVVKGMDPFTIAATSPSHFSAFRRLSFICLFPINNILLLSLECNYFNWVVKTKEQKTLQGKMPMESLSKCQWPTKAAPFITNGFVNTQPHQHLDLMLCSKPDNRR